LRAGRGGKGGAAFWGRQSKKKEKITREEQSVRQQKQGGGGDRVHSGCAGMKKKNVAGENALREQAIAFVEKQS